MINLRRSQDRGHADHGWLRSAHSFSFGSYQDPRFMGHGNLRVINEDRIKPGSGFATHGHRDMEIVSVVLEGALQHRDSLGNGSTIVPGEVQRMSAGRGILHSEENAAPAQDTHFLQIWFMPDEPGGEPGYAQQAIAPGCGRGQLCLWLSPDGSHGSLAMRADARLYGGLFDSHEQARLALAPGRLAYVHLIRGTLCVNGQHLQSGDALLMEDESVVDIAQGQDAQVLVFDLAQAGGHSRP